jgi:hypothetical protein
MASSRSIRYSPAALGGVLLLSSAFFVQCGGTGKSSSSATTGTVATSISDPAVCTASFDQVEVTITKVTANISADAGPTDSGWVTLLDLSASPKQVNLLSLTSTTCVLTQLGSTSGLAPGNYQQIRLYLLDNSPSSGTATPSPNACGSAGFNCVVPSGGSPQTLELSSEAKTGIKIPSGQISAGGLKITAGQSADLNIDFDSCASIVRQGNGTYRLKPVLHAGEVSVNNNSISGTVTDQNSNPITGAIVLLEQPDSNKVDRVQLSGVSASDGTFIFCPLPNPNGNTTFDVVVGAESSNLFSTTTYNSTIAFSVPVGTNLNNVPLVSEGTPSSPASPGALSGQLLSSGTGGPAVADVTLSVLLEISGGAANEVTMPVLSAPAQPPVATTAPCSVNADCVNYTLLLSTSTPQVGTFTSGAVSYSLASGTLAYSLEAVAPSCTGVTPASGSIGSLALTAGRTTPVGPFAFTGCTAP